MRHDNLDQQFFETVVMSEVPSDLAFSADAFHDSLNSFLETSTDYLNDAW